jgi:hypothetical protein
MIELTMEKAVLEHPKVVEISAWRERRDEPSGGALIGKSSVTPDLRDRGWGARGRPPLSARAQAHRMRMLAHLASVASGE